MKARYLYFRHPRKVDPATGTVYPYALVKEDTETGKVTGHYSGTGYTETPLFARTDNFSCLKYPDTFQQITRRKFHVILARMRRRMQLKGIRADAIIMDDTLHVTVNVKPTTVADHINVEFIV